ncbi:unnamed protein product [Allacma fusca]|uniref:RRM domain-containing protein n=1 Tax=Allacma fusca TaxID=39272 RepID=A0A8J2PIP8_9HEXA|nr:unnamed protein product [Allacma fusca]
MSVIIRLQNLPLSANSIDIRNFFRGLAIPDGGVHIVGGSEGDAFIAFSTDEDARQGMQLSGTCLKDSPVKLFLSSRNEMYKVIEQARQQALGLMPVSSSSSSPTENSPLPASQPSQQTPSTASIHSQSSNTLPLSMATGGNSMLPGLGLAYPGANSNSNPPISFPGIGSLGASSVSMGPTNFSGAIGSQGNGAGGYPSVFSPQQTSGPPGPGSLGPRNMNPMNQISQNPFVMSQSTSGNNIPIGFPSNMPNGPMSSNIMGNAATNPNLIGMSSSNMPILSGSNQFGIGAGNRMPMLNSGSGNHPGGIISPFAMGQVPQSGYSGLNPNLMSSANNVGNGNHIGGPMGGNQVRPNFHQNNTSLPNRDNRRLGERPVNNFGKVNAGPMAALRDRDNVGFTARAVDRDTRGRERERGERGKRSQSRSRDRKDARDRSRRRSRSRERSRERRRVRRSKSRSRSRDRERTRSRRGSSRDRDRGREERRRSDAGSGGSPEKGLKGDVSSPAGKFGTLSVDSEKKYIGKDRRDSSVENIVVTITDESSPCAKLSGLSKDTSFREIREFIRVEVQGGGEGVVRNYDKGLAFLKLENPAEFPRLLRQNGLKLRGNLVKVEGISLDVWESEYRLNKRQQEREKERDKEIRERDRGDRDRDRDHREPRDRSDTRDRPRTSRFNGGASSQSNCITIRGLPPAITTKDVTSKFFRDLNVVDIVCVPSESSTGRVTTTVLVQLDSLVSAQTAVDVIVKSPEGANFPVDFCELEDVQRAKREIFGGRGGSTRDYKGPGEAKSLFELDVGLDMDSSIVMISGVPPQTKERSVLDFFSEIGVTPLSVRLMYDQNGAMPNGQVVCEFPDPSKARRATWKDGTLFGRVPVKVSLLPSGNSHNRTNNPSHMGSLAGNHNSSQFPPRGTRPSLLGPRPAIPNSNAARFQSNHQSQNPFTQALQQSMPSPNNSNMMVNVPRLRGPVGERSTRFSSNNGGSGAADREDRSKHGVNRQDDMAPFENPGCVLALENVPFKASMDDILNFLKDMLKIQIPRSRIIRRFDDNQKPTGDARVAFDTPFEAKLAYQRLLGSTMWKRQISVSILSYF